MLKLNPLGIFQRLLPKSEKPWVLSTLSEPKIVTLIMVATYLLAIASGSMLVFSGVYATHPLYSPLAILSGITLGLSGLVGIPTAWLGKHWVERGAAIGLAAGAFFVGFTILVSYIEHLSPPLTVESIFNVLWTGIVFLYGLNRFERCRLAPYALGKGPLLPEHKKLVAISKMDLDWQAATNPGE